MDKTGASKGFVLVISLGDFSTDYLEDENGNLLIFDRFDEIYAYCTENNINIDEVNVAELAIDNGDSEDLGKPFYFPEVEF